MWDWQSCDVYRSLLTAIRGCISELSLLNHTSTFRSTDPLSSTEDKTKNNRIYRCKRWDPLSLFKDKVKTSEERPSSGGCHHTGWMHPTKNWLQSLKCQPPASKRGRSSSSSPPTPWAPPAGSPLLLWCWRRSQGDLHAGKHCQRHNGPRVLPL